MPIFLRPYDIRRGVEPLAVEKSHSGELLPGGDPV